MQNQSTNIPFDPVYVHPSWFSELGWINAPKPDIDEILSVLRAYDAATRNFYTTPTATPTKHRWQKPQINLAELQSAAKHKQDAEDVLVRMLLRLKHDPIYKSETFTDYSI